MTNIIALGECMVEFHTTDGNTYHKGFSGDVLNSCIYLKRALTAAGDQQDTVFFMSAIGNDLFSNEMAASWQQEGIDQTLVFCSQERVPGLYIIRTDETGERSFNYWRESSAARHTLKQLKTSGGLNSLPNADLFYFSGISIAILDEEDRKYLLKMIRHLRETGTKVAFDPNYRAQLWSSAEDAAYWMNEYYQLCDIALPGLEDEQALYSQTSVDDVFARLTALNVPEIIVKAGTEGIFGQGLDGGFHIPFKAADRCIDTTAAGDSFSGVYLAQRAMAKSPQEAVTIASNAAAFVVGYAGAITPYADFNTFMKTNV